MSRGVTDGLHVAVEDVRSGVVPVRLRWGRLGST